MEQKETYHEISTNLAPLLNAFSHPARVQIIMHLAKYKSCQARSISERLPLAKSTVSEHLSKLKEAGLIECTPDGICSNYRLNDDKFELIKDWFNKFINIVEESRIDPDDCCMVEPFEMTLGSRKLRVVNI